MTPSRKSPTQNVIAERAEEAADVSELVSRLEAEADDELAAGTITLRWGEDQIAVVKRAAAILGVPYGAYLKEVVFRQALADIEQADAVLGPKPRAKRSGGRSRPRQR